MSIGMEFFHFFAWITSSEEVNVLPTRTQTLYKWENIADIFADNRHTQTAIRKPIKGMIYLAV